VECKAHQRHGLLDGLQVLHHFLVICVEQVNDDSLRIPNFAAHGKGLGYSGVVELVLGFFVLKEAFLRGDQL